MTTQEIGEQSKVKKIIDALDNNVDNETIIKDFMTDGMFGRTDQEMEMFIKGYLLCLAKVNHSIIPAEIFKKIETYC